MDEVIKLYSALYLILNGFGWGIGTHLRFVANSLELQRQILHLREHFPQSIIALYTLNFAKVLSFCCN